MNPRHRFDAELALNPRHPAATAAVRARAARLDGCLADGPSTAARDADRDLRHRTVPGGHATGTPVDGLEDRDYETAPAAAPTITGIEVIGLALMVACIILGTLTVFFALWHWSPLIAGAVGAAGIGAGVDRARRSRGEVRQ